jgi:hypothetical protein
MLNMRIHELKTRPEPYDAMMLGLKTFEVRKNDRDFRVGDTLMLREWDPDTKKYTGNFIKRDITYILKGGLFGLPDDLVIMSIV